MKARNVSVTFHVDVYNRKPWFPLPRAIARVFSLKAGDVIAVSISTPRPHSKGCHLFSKRVLSGCPWTLNSMTEA